MNIKQEKRGEEKKLVTDKIIYWISELKIKFFCCAALSQIYYMLHQLTYHYDIIHWQNPLTLYLKMLKNDIVISMIKT